MLLCTFIAFTFIINSSVAARIDAIKDNIPWPPKMGIYIQAIDHFSFHQTGTIGSGNFKQRYLYEDKWYKPGGPLFFYCGNEGTITSFWKNTGFMFDIAPTFNALIVFGEHRYYGESMPFGQKSFKPDNIAFLSIEQALADYAYLIPYLKTHFKIPKATAVITFGGSYGGMLSGYMRFKYPHIVNGAIVASAPFQWISGLGNFNQFFQVITNDFYQINPKCVAIVQAAYRQIDLFTQQGNLKLIGQKLKLCSSLRTVADVDFIKKWARNAFIMMSMMDYPYAASFMGSLPANPVKVACMAMLNASDPLSALSRAIDVFYGNKKCHVCRKEFYPCSDISGCGNPTDPSSIAWDFQACTEMSLFSNPALIPNQMIPALPQFQNQTDSYCKKKYGVTRASSQLATLLGGIKIQTTTNMLFSNGKLDPWSLGGVLSNKSLPDSSAALIIEGGAHHLDMRSSNPKDPTSVILARKTEVEYIKRWIANAK